MTDNPRVPTQDQLEGKRARKRAYDQRRILTEQQLEEKRARKRAYDKSVAEKNAALRAEAIRLGLASKNINEIPPQVFARGVVLREMMRAPFCMWAPEWTEDVSNA